MERYGDILGVTFAGGVLALPISVRLARVARPRPAGGDGDAFATSVQLDRPLVSVEVRIRDSAAAESLSLGQSGTLSVEIGATRSGQQGRILYVQQAVVTGIELEYRQAAPAVAVVTFTGEAVDGGIDPFSSQESQP
jgi:hypothetical protein